MPKKACSIRLIVPKNMRILAKLNARRLTFTEEHHQQLTSSLFGPTQDPRPEVDSTLWVSIGQPEEVMINDGRSLILLLFETAPGRVLFA